MTTLKALAQAAMLGTGSGFTPPVLDHVHIPAADPEAALLASAVAVGIAEMGGSLPPNLESAGAACSPESQPQISERAARLFKQALADEFDWALPEFLEQIAARGLVVPPETLPALLGLGKTDLRSQVIQVGGARARWLAGQNAAWAYALGREPQAAWEHGLRVERVAALEQTRASQPDQALAWVQSTWEQDAPEDRAAFVRALRIGLSMNDEPFLEACLDDQRKEVRDAARGLLMGLPHSRFTQRMWGRVRPLLNLKPKFLGGDKLEVSLPGDLDAAAKRDGLGGVPLRKKLGEKANLLAQMLALIPPDGWRREFGWSPEKLLAVAASCEWKEPVILGWQLAAGSSRDSEWAEALAAFWMNHAAGQQVVDAESLDEIISLMRVEQVEALVVESIKTMLKELDDKNPLLALLEKYQRPWTARMARTVIHSAQRQSGNPGTYRLPMALPGFARWIPPELSAEFSTGWPAEPKGYYIKGIEQFLQILNFRAEIRQSLQE